MQSKSFQTHVEEYMYNTCLQNLVKWKFEIAEN